MIGIQDSNQKIVPNGLLLSLDAAQLRSYPTSGSNWNDITPSGSNFTLTNGPTFDSANGGNITFDGVDDFAVLPFTTILNDCSIELWFRAPTSQSYQELFSLQNPSADATFNFIIDMNDPDQPGGGNPYNAKTMWVFWDGYGNDKHSVISTSLQYSPWVDNTWRHYVFTRGVSTTTNHYMNGSIITTNVNRIGDQTIKFGNGAGYEIKLGKATFGGSPAFFPGKEGIVRVYNRELSAAEVLQNYNADKTRYGHS